MEIYNKLVRDKIPDIIERQGKKANVRKLNNEEYINELNKKLLEEVSEYIENSCVEELADIQEVILAIADVQKFELDRVKDKKRNDRGGFEK